MRDLRAALTERILVLDGAMGTMVQAAGLSAEDFGGPALDGCNEHLNLTRPDVIEAIHAAYFDAGADIACTNTFGCAPYVLGEYGLADRAYEISLAAARIARRVADAAPGRFVIGAMGPSTRSISVTRNVSFQEVTDAYGVQAAALIAGGVDALLLETQQDTLNLKAAAIGVRDAMRAADRTLPLMASGTVEPTGTMLAGQNVEALYVALEHLDLLSIGLNCATGPEFMTDHLRSLAALSTRFISVYPNAGLPDERGLYGETPQSLAFKMRRFVDEGWVNLIGGCCGTTPPHIRAIAEMVRGRPPRVPAAAEPVAVSGVEVLYPTEDNRPIFVGERTNVIGSRRFKELIANGQVDEAAEIGRAQVRASAQVLDVCLANPDRDEREDMDRFMASLTRKVKVPLMIDSTDAEVIELALRHCQGKAIVNSINLEDGEERFARVVPLLRTYGAAVVVGCIDEDKQQGMAVTRQRKLAIAERSYALLTATYGVPARDLIFDALVFPVGTGDANYVGSAVETIEGIRLIKERLPECRTILGISNVSFGLPPAGREVLNSVFLYHCTKAGLDYAIVNTERLERYPSIPDEEKRLAEDLLYMRGADPVAAFAAHFRERTTRTRAAASTLTLDERLARYIVEGSRDGLIDDLTLKLKDAAPLAIINGPLMAGMEEVGRLFNDNQLIVAEVLQSAEAMKAAVAHLEPFMEKSESATRGTLVLATVKGDVHDIGKNLVEIILGNNGYRIVNLGIKVPPEELIAAYQMHKPDAFGLSGLLVKSAQQMVVTAQDLKAAGIDIPLFVGGAALTRKFTATRIAPEYAGTTLYAKDAMDGLDLANQLFSPLTREALIERIRAEQAALHAGAELAPAKPGAAVVTSRAPVPAVDPPPPPDLERHVLRDVPLSHIYPYLNLQMLYGKHLGLRGIVTRLLEEGDAKARELAAVIEALQRDAVADRLLRADGVYQWFRARAAGDSLIVMTPDGREQARFTFPRQRDGERLNLADYVREDADDWIAMFAVTCGAGVRERAQAWKERGEYLRSHALQALAIECAEAFAEMLHARLRTQWGFPDPPELAIEDKLKARYRGLRVSFGYPACPDLSDQATLWKLLEPEQIGIALTEGFMMDPEASVSALVFHHPAARYFKAGD
jgi:5-methyltetrahydrofolate--homocysteine methyltransferase